MKQLPVHPSLDFLRQEAKDLLRDYRQGDQSARDRFADCLPGYAPGVDLRLHDAQSAVARDYGFDSWKELSAEVQLRRALHEDQMEAFCRAVFGHQFDSPQPEFARKLLQAAPDSQRDPFVQLTIGQLPEELDPNRPLGPLQMPPLCAVTHSSLYQLPEFESRLLPMIQSLLQRGADPKSSYYIEFWKADLSALYGAAGRLHHLEATRILLEAGANPNDNESLYHSVEVPDRSVTRLLVEFGARWENSNAFIRQLDYEEPEATTVCLDLGADPNEPGRPALLHAMRRGRSERVLRLLIERGANFEFESDGLAGADWARAFGWAELLPGVELSEKDRFLRACRRGDEAEALALKHWIPELSPQELKLLPTQAEAGELAAVRVMVRAGWPLEVKGDSWSASALNHATFNCDVAMARVLLEHGASWESRHNYDDNVLGTLAFSSRNIRPRRDSDTHEALARLLVEFGVPIPDDLDHYSDEVAEAYLALRG